MVEIKVRKGKISIDRKKQLISGVTFADYFHRRLSPAPGNYLHKLSGYYYRL